MIGNKRQLAIGIVRFSSVALLASLFVQWFAKADFRGLPFLFFGIAILVAGALLIAESRTQ